MESPPITVGAGGAHKWLSFPHQAVPATVTTSGLNDHTHYQHVCTTTYPATRRKLAQLHADRAKADINAPGWVVGAETRLAALEASMVKES